MCMPTRPNLILPNPILPNPNLPNLILPNPILPNPILPNLILRNPSARAKSTHALAVPNPPNPHVAPVSELALLQKTRNRHTSSMNDGGVAPCSVPSLPCPLACSHLHNVGVAHRRADRSLHEGHLAALLVMAQLWRQHHHLQGDHAALPQVCRGMGKKAGVSRWHTRARGLHLDRWWRQTAGCTRRRGAAFGHATQASRLSVVGAMARHRPCSLALDAHAPASWGHLP
jgi:hypothetical protein